MYPYNDLGKRSNDMNDEHSPTSTNERRSRTITVGIDYARLSMNRGKLSDNCAIQHRECGEYIDDEGWKHGGSFEDDDISASKYSTKPRLDYERMVSYIRSYKPPTGTTVKLVIVVTEMERLYRQLDELLALIKIAEKERTCLHAICTTDGDYYDLSTPEGIHRAIGAVNNAMRESGKLSRRQRRKKATQAKQGRWSGGGRPYAYEADGITIRESEADVVRECVRRLIAGHSQMSVVRWLNETGHPTVLGKQWMVGNFNRMITKKRYVISGQHLHDCPDDCIIPHAWREHVPENGEPGGYYPAVWPGFIAAEDYEMLLFQLESAKQPWNHGPAKGRTYALSGIARCGSCGSAMYGQKRKLSNGSTQRRYRCRGVDNHGIKVGCGKVFRDADALEAYVFWNLLERLDTPEMAKALSSKDDQDQAQVLARTLLRLKLRRKEIAAKLALADDSDAEDLQVMLKTVRTEQERIQEQLNVLQREKTAKMLPDTGPLRAAFGKADIAGKRTIIQLVYKEIRVLPGHPRSKKWMDYNFDTDAVILVDAIDTV